MVKMTEAKKPEEIISLVSRIFFVILTMLYMLISWMFRTIQKIISGSAAE